MSESELQLRVAEQERLAGERLNRFFVWNGRFVRTRTRTAEFWRAFWLIRFHDASVGLSDADLDLATLRIDRTIAVAKERGIKTLDPEIQARFREQLGRIRSRLSTSRRTLERLRVQAAERRWRVPFVVRRAVPFENITDWIDALLGTITDLFERRRELLAKLREILIPGQKVVEVLPLDIESADRKRVRLVEIDTIPPIDSLDAKDQQMFAEDLVTAILDDFAATQVAKLQDRNVTVTGTLAEGMSLFVDTELDNYDGLRKKPLFLIRWEYAFMKKIRPTVVIDLVNNIWYGLVDELAMFDLPQFAGQAGRVARLLGRLKDKIRTIGRRNITGEELPSELKDALARIGFAFV